MRLAYLTAQYPKASHTFIRREIRGLESLGHPVTRLSVRSTSPGDLVDPADVDEARRTHVFFGASPLAWARALGLGLLTRPAAIVRELLRALGPSRGPGPDRVRRLAYWLQAIFFLEIARRERIEHVHAHFGRNPASVARIMKRLGGPSYSMTVHGPHEFDDPLGHELAAKVADSSFTAAVSHYTAAQLRRWADPSQWSKLHVVHCTVDEAFFAAARPIQPDGSTLLCVGRLCAQKGQLLLVEAFARLLARGCDARLVLAGDGELRPDVEASLLRLGLADRVEITGWLSEQQVRDRILACRAVVLPSFAEGLPVVLMEALAMARPVISTWIAGIPELVRDGENGWLVPAGDVEALEHALREALSRPAEQLDAMGRAGAARVRDRHLLATEVARLEELLARCAGPPG